MKSERIIHRAWQAAGPREHPNYIGLWLLVEESTNWTVESVRITAGGALSSEVLERGKLDTAVSAGYERRRLDALLAGWSPYGRLDPAVMERIEGPLELQPDEIIGVEPPIPAVVPGDQLRRLRQTPGQVALVQPGAGARVLLGVGGRGVTVNGYGSAAGSQNQRLAARGALLDALRVARDDGTPQLVFDALWSERQLCLLDLLSYEGDLRREPYALRRQLLSQVIDEEFVSDGHAVRLLALDPEGHLVVDAAAEYGVGQVRAAA